MKEEGDRERKEKGKKGNLECQKGIRHSAGNIHKCDLIFTMKETTLNAENHVK